MSAKSLSVGRRYGRGSGLPNGQCVLDGGSWHAGVCLGWVRFLIALALSGSDAEAERRGHEKALQSVSELHSTA